MIFVDLENIIPRSGLLRAIKRLKVQDKVINN